jgi:hypothetical protein
VHGPNNQLKHPTRPRFHTPRASKGRSSGHKAEPHIPSQSKAHRRPTHTVLPSIQYYLRRNLRCPGPIPFVNGFTSFFSITSPSFIAISSPPTRTSLSRFRPKNETQKNAPRSLLAGQQSKVQPRLARIRNLETPKYVRRTQRHHTSTTKTCTVARAHISISNTRIG